MKTNTSTISYVIVLVLLLSPSAFASNGIEITPDNLWHSIDNEQWIDPIYPQIQINVECNHSNIDEAYIKKSSSSISKIKLYNTTHQNIYSATENIVDLYTLSNSGVYTVSAACGNGTLSNEFTIHNLRGSVENIQGFSAEGYGPIYLGNSYLDENNELQVYVRLYDIIAQAIRDISIEEDISFTKVTFLENTDIAFSDPRYFNKYGTIVLILKDLNDKGISNNKEYTLKIDVKYVVDGSAKSFSFNAKRPIFFGNNPENADQSTQTLEPKITIYHDSDLLVTDESLKTINLEIITENAINFSLNKGNTLIELYKNGNSKIKNIDIDSISRDGNMWSIRLKKLPVLDEGEEYSLKVTVTYESITEYDTIDIRQAVVFEGVMKDSSGVVVPATIEFDGPILEKATVGGDGRYKAVLVPGLYNILINYDKFSASIPLNIDISNAEINSNTMEMAPDPIKFSHYPKNINLNDMAVADLVDFQFAVPFKYATIKMPYDEGKIYDDNEIDVFMCSNWNQGRVDCVGNWERLDDIAINTINNFISFNTDKLSAFVISGRETLALQIEALPEKYYSKEQIMIKGKVTTNNEIAVKNANVNYFIKDTQISGTVKTDISGSFQAEVNAPEQEGKYELIVGVQKEPYHSSEMQPLYINVEKKKDVTIILPEVATTVLDDETHSSVRFRIKNSGQDDLTNVVVSVAAQGLSRDKYSVEPAIVDKLAVGAEKEIDINIPLTSEYCQNMGCMTVYSFLVQISSDQLKEAKSSNLIVEVKTKEDVEAMNNPDAVSKETDSVKETDASDNNSFFQLTKNIPSVTGLSVSSASVNTGMILVTIVLCFIIVALKKRKQGMGRGMAQRRQSNDFSFIKRRFKRM